MPVPFDTEVVVIRVAQDVAIPAANLTAGDVASIDSRLDALEAGAIDLNDLIDVNTAGVVNGNALVYDSMSSTWEAGVAGGFFNSLTDNVVTRSNVSVISVGQGLQVFNGGDPGLGIVIPVYGGTGLAETLARSDHVHSAVVPYLNTGAPTGNLSSGTRTIVSGTSAPLASGIPYYVRGEFVIRARNNVDNGTVNLLFRVGTEVAYPERSRNVGTVGGVPVDQVIKFYGFITGAGVGVPVSAKVQYSSGSATDLRDHELLVEFFPQR